MNAAAPLPHTPPPDAPTDAESDAAWARRVLRRQVERLDRLAEDGMRIAGAIERQATADESDPAAPAVVRGDVAVAYARVARAVRLTLMLQAQVVQQVLDPAGERARPAPAPRTAGREPPLPQTAEGRRALALRVVARAAREQYDSPEACERLDREAAERLEDLSRYGDGLSLPVSEMIGRLSEDLDLGLDWPQLKTEPWAKAELESGRAGPLLTHPPRCRFVVDWAPEAPRRRAAAYAASP